MNEKISSLSKINHTYKVWNFNGSSKRWKGTLKGTDVCPGNNRFYCSKWLHQPALHKHTHPIVTVGNLSSITNHQLYHKELCVLVCVCCTSCVSGLQEFNTPEEDIAPDLHLLHNWSSDKCQQISLNNKCYSVRTQTALKVGVEISVGKQENHVTFKINITPSWATHCLEYCQFLFQI